MTKNFIQGSILSFIVVVMAFALMYNGARVSEASPADATRIDIATTSAAVSVTSSQRILATTTSLTGTSYTRVYATICNPSSTIVYVNLDGDKAASSAGGNFTTVIAAAAGYDACYEITDRNLYMGSVTASSTNQTAATIYVKDYVQ